MTISRKLRKTLVLAAAMVTAVGTVNAMPTIQATTITEALLIAPPRIEGLRDIAIQRYGRFSLIEGITASDEIDGNLSSKITISGMVNTTMPGRYELTYSVTNSSGITMEEVRVITVYDKREGDTYDVNYTYLEGESVIYCGEEYIAQWWTKGDLPDQSLAWEPVNGREIDAYVEGKVYYAGDRVMFNNNMYIADWRTSAQPDSDIAWRKIF